MLSNAARPYIQASVPVLQAHGLAITTTFYRNMFNAHPELKNLFNMGNQANGSQQQSLAATVFAYAANIDNAAALKPVMERIVHKHAAVGIKPEHYPIVGRYLLGAIAEVLAEGATLALMAAWDEAYWLLASELIAAEARLYQSSGYDADTWISSRVVDKVKSAEGVISIRLETNSQYDLPKFWPGQYVSVAISLPEGLRQLRQYSLSDSADKNSYRLTVKQEAGNAATPRGEISNWLHENIKVGDILNVSHPYGDFIPDLEINKPIVLLSAGVGITPMLSILNTLKSFKSEREIWFLHANRSLEYVSHLDEVIANAEELPRLIVGLYLEDKPGFAPDRFVYEGRMNLAKWPFDSSLNAEYYICGPLSFMTEQWKALIAKGINPQNIHREVFGPESLNHLGA